MRSPQTRFSWQSLPLQGVLIVPFVFQVLVTISLVIYLSYRSSQQAIGDLAQNHIAQIADQAEDRLDQYLHSAQEVVALNLLAIQDQSFDPNDTEVLKKRFYRQMNVFQEPATIFFADRQGYYHSISRDKFGLVGPLESILFTTTQADRQWEFWLLDGRGQSQKRLQMIPQWDARSRPWYQMAQDLPPNQQGWSNIYAWAGLPLASISAIAPVYKQGQFQGVIGADIVLAHVSDFLANLYFSPNSKVFILERNGDLIASSTREQTFVSQTQPRSLIRLNGKQSEDPLIRQTTLALGQQWGDLHKIQTSHQIHFTATLGDHHAPQRQTAFAQVIPYQDRYGLDWLIVVAIPETDFLSVIRKNTLYTLLWSSVFLFISLFLGLYTSRILGNPLLELRRRLLIIHHHQSLPDRQHPLHHSPLHSQVQEIQELITAFDDMNQRIQSSFQTFTDLNAELEASKARLQTFLDVIPVGITIHHNDGSLMYMNRIAKQLLQPGIMAGAGLPEQVEMYKIYRAGTDILYPPDALPAAQALRGQSVTLNDIEVRLSYRSVFVEAEATPILNHKNQVLYAIVAFQDITLRRSMEKMMEEYQHNLEIQVQERTQSLQQEIQERERVELALRLANQQLERIAQTDGLTMVPNRRHFDLYLQKEWQRAKREQQCLSLILLDVDYFKLFNDTYGHLQGDDCLRHVAQAVQKSLRRATDFVARYGGEEFAVILPHTDQEGAAVIAAQIRQKVRDLNIAHQTSTIAPMVTVSLGISCVIPQDGGGVDHLIQRADQALYWAKAAGRDRYRVFTDETTHSPIP